MSHSLRGAFDSFCLGIRRIGFLRGPCWNFQPPPPRIRPSPSSTVILRCATPVFAGYPSFGSSPVVAPLLGLGSLRDFVAFSPLPSRAIQCALAALPPSLLQVSRTTVYVSADAGLPMRTSCTFVVIPAFSLLNSPVLRLLRPFFSAMFFFPYSVFVLV